MTASNGAGYDYLHGLVKDQLDQLRRFGPIVFEIFETLETSGAQIQLDPLIDQVLSQQRVVVRVVADLINMRAGPSLQSQIIKLQQRDNQLLIVEPRDYDKIGLNDVWLHVLDMDGALGYVVSHYVALDQDYGNPQYKVEVLMRALDNFNRMDLVTIDPKFGSVNLTTKGENIARILTQHP